MPADHAYHRDSPNCYCYTCDPVNNENVQDGGINDEHGISQNPLQTKADDECIPDENTVPPEIATEDMK